MATTASMPAYMLPGVAVHQPPHLEGDPSLATEILPGPPLLVSAQQSVQKRDPRKPSTAYSYLPPSDPGSTYSGVMHGTLIGHEEPRSKSSRLDKGATGRAQRASARNQTSVSGPLDSSASIEGASSSGLHSTILDTDSFTLIADDEASLSRSNSSLNLQDPPAATTTGKPRKKDKGKGKEVETPPVRVKEEPKAILLHTPEPTVNLLNNNDHCSSCRSYGALVYCDGCPRAFHLWCLDPPMEGVDEGDSRWFCPSCTIREHPPQKPPPSLLSPLIYQVETSIPTEFQLPDEIRNFFRDVVTGPKGTYIDGSEIKPPRLNRHGQLEERDPYRLRDRNGAPVLCFQCGMSALPSGLASTTPIAKRARRSVSKPATSAGAWKSVVSCDYCNLHWHLDCLSPPLATMPPFNKKWMCPNHVERIIHPKRRLPKHNAPPIDITKPRQFNNGNIDVTHPEISTHNHKPRVLVDDVLINGRRYRVPEKIIVLDFWNKLIKQDVQEARDLEAVSAVSSPLTSLSSLEDLDEHTPETVTSNDENDDLRAAQLLCNFSAKTLRLATSMKAKLADHAVQTDPDQQPSQSITTAPRVVRSHKKVTSTRPKHPNLNGIIKPPVSLSGETAASASVPATSTAKRKKPTQTAQTESSTRELRSRSRNNQHDPSGYSTASKAGNKGADGSSLTSATGTGTQNASKYRTINVKLEEVENPLSTLANGSGNEPSASAMTSTSQTPRRRPSRRSTLKEFDDIYKETSEVKETKERRGRKRKARDDDLPEMHKTLPTGVGRSTEGKRSKRGKDDSADEHGTREKRKVANTPSRHSNSATDITPTLSAASGRQPPLTPLPSTPSLKIRLPRLNSVNKQNATRIPSSNAETPTRL